MAYRSTKNNLDHIILCMISYPCNILDCNPMFAIVKNTLGMINTVSVLEDYSFCEDFCFELKPADAFDRYHCEAIGVRQCEACHQDLIAAEYDREVTYLSVAQ